MRVTHLLPICLTLGRLLNLFEAHSLQLQSASGLCAQGIERIRQNILQPVASAQQMGATASPHLPLSISSELQVEQHCIKPNLPQTNRYKQELSPYGISSRYKETLLEDLLLLALFPWTVPFFSCARLCRPITTCPLHHHRRLSSVPCGLLSWRQRRIVGRQKALQSRYLGSDPHLCHFLCGLGRVPQLLHC